MSRLKKALESARRQNPLEGFGEGVLSCSFGEPATQEEITAAWGDTPLPADVLEFWSHCSFAKLFVNAGESWGIELMTPAASRLETDEQADDVIEILEPGDIAIGKFHGYIMWLIRKAAPGPGVLVVDEVTGDPYETWSVLGDSLAEFIEKFLRAQGEFWWEEKPFVEPQVGTWPLSYQTSLDAQSSTPEN